MKVLYFIDTLYNSGGMERVLTVKANALSEEYGYEVVIVTSHQRGRTPFFPLGLKVRLLDVDVNSHLPFMTSRLVKRLSNVVLSERPDICISMCSRELDLLPSLPATGVKMAEFHFCREAFRISGHPGRVTRMQNALPALDCFVALTKEDADAWRPFCRRIEQIYDPLTIGTDARRASLGAHRCISAGRFEHQKNFQDLVLVWARVHQRHPDWRLDIYGDGSQKHRIERLIREKGLSESVFLHPATKRLREEMLSSSLFLMTPLYEGFLLVMLEAASVGLPFIGYACPCGPSEFIENGIQGYTVPVGDIEGMADRICHCIEQPELRAAMGKAAREKSEAFTMDRIMPRWDALFRSLVQASGSSGPDSPRKNPEQSFPGPDR